MNHEKTVQIPLKKISKGSNRFWVGSISLNTFNNLFETDLIFLLNNLNGKIYFYNSKGWLIYKCNFGESIFLVNHLKFQVLSPITSTGLQIKSDPSLGVVYLSFFLLILSIYVSFFTYSQIWVVELIQKIQVGGKSNRAVLFFQEDFRKIIKNSTNL